jgi:hypothetical protein
MILRVSEPATLGEESCNIVTAYPELSVKSNVYGFCINFEKISLYVSWINNFTKKIVLDRTAQ